MGTAFDPYHRWLGIPPAEQPPHLYRLLGLRPLEDDPDVIENAADQRLAHLRTFQAGANSHACAKLLNEVSAAKITLLNPEKKAGYDQRLQAQLAPPHAEPVDLPVASPAPPPLPTAQSIPTAQPQPTPGAPYGAPTAGQVNIGTKVRVGRRRSNSMAATAVTAIILALLIGAAALVAFRSSGPDGAGETALSFDWPTDQRQGAAMKVDGHSVDIPTTGPWQYPCEPGDHDVEVARSGYDAVRQTVHVDEGQSRAIDIVWTKSEGGTTTPVAGSRDLPRGQAIELLPRVDAAADPLSGTWTREGPRLRAASDRDACLALPVRIDATHYQISAVVTFKKFGSAELCLPCGPRRFNLVVAEKESQLSKADGKIVTQPLPRPLSLDAPQRIEVDVLRGSRETEIRLSLGGPPVLSWKGDENLLTGWHLTDRRRPALGAHAGELVYDSARLKIIEGSASWIEGREKPLPGAEPPVAVTPTPVKPTPVQPTPVVPPSSGDGDPPVTVAGMNPKPFQPPAGAASVPEYLLGGTTFDFPRQPLTHTRNGVLDFVVKRDCVVYLLANWKYQGNRGGGWYEERLTREQLVTRGWRDLGPLPWDKDTVAMERQCHPGETYSIRTNKYWPPKLIVPASGAKPPPDQPTPTPPPEPTPPEPPRELLAVPSDEDQKPVRDQLEEIYKLSQADTSARKLELARELTRVSEESLDKPTERFVLLDTAVRLAGAGGDASLMLEAADKLAAAYRLDVTNYRADAVVALASAAGDATALRALYTASQEVIDRAIDEKRFDLAAQVANAVNQACQQPQGIALRKQAYDRQQAVAELFGKWQQGQKAIAALKDAPDDPEANLAAGRWYCFGADDWAQGLACLAKGSDPQWKSLAAKDLAASPDDATGHVDLADAWWDAAQAAGQADKPLMLARAGYWYRKARGGSLASLLAMKVDKRLEEIEPLLDEGDHPPSGPADATLFEPNKFVDLIPYVDPARDAVQGTWQPSSDDLTVASGRECRLTLPFTLEGSYDFEVEFVRTDGDGPIAMIFPVGDRQIALVFSVDGGKCSGLELLDRRAVDSPRNPSTRRPGILQNGRRYTALVGVRINKAGALVDVVFNGKKYIRTMGTLDGLSLPSHWDLGNSACAGLGADRAAVKFNQARIRIVEGKATPLPR